MVSRMTSSKSKLPTINQFIFLQRSGLSFLKIGITLANLHKSGKIPVLNDKFIMLHNLFEKKLLEIFNMWTGIL